MVRRREEIFIFRRDAADLMLCWGGMSEPSHDQEQPKTGAQLSVTTAALLATWRTMRRLFILVIGLTVLLIGVVMVVTPGPSILVIPLGLAILGIEFAWARRWLAKFKSYLPKRKPAAGVEAGAQSKQSPIAPGSVPSAPLSSSAETASTAAAGLPR